MWLFKAKYTTVSGDEIVREIEDVRKQHFMGKEGIKHE